MSAFLPMLAQHGHSLQAGEDLAPAAQGAALFMTGIVGVMLLSIAVGVFVLVRRARRGESPEQALLRELRAEPKKRPEEEGKDLDKPTAENKKPPNGWEKDPDWWKDGSASDKSKPEKS